MEKMILVTLLVIGYSTIIIKLFWSFGSKNQKNQCQKYRKIKLSLVFIVVLITSSSSALLNYSLNQKNIENEMDELDNVIKDFDRHVNSTIVGLNGNPSIGELPNIGQILRNESGFEGIDSTKEILNKFDMDDLDSNSKKLKSFCSQAEIKCPNGSLIYDNYNLWYRYTEFLDYDWEIKEGIDQLSPMLNSIVPQSLELVTRLQDKLVKHQQMIKEHLKQTKRFFEKFQRVLTKVRVEFQARKMEVTTKEIFYTNIFLVPLGFSIIFGISICFTVLFDNRVISIISSVLFYILILQIITVSLLSMYNQSTVRLKIKEHERFLKIFDIPISSYNNKEISNAYYSLIVNCKQKSEIFSDFEYSIFINDYPSFQQYRNDLNVTFFKNWKNIVMPDLKEINEGHRWTTYMLKSIDRLNDCPSNIMSQIDEHRNWLASVEIHLRSWIQFIGHYPNMAEFVDTVLTRELTPLEENVFRPVERINDSLISLNFECSGIYDGLANGHVSSYQPYPDIYRTHFKITVVFGGTLLLVLYLWSTIEYETQSAENSNSPDVPRSPKRD